VLVWEDLHPLSGGQHCTQTYFLIKTNLQDCGFQWKPQQGACNLGQRQHHKTLSCERSTACEGKHRTGLDGLEMGKNVKYF